MPLELEVGGKSNTAGLGRRSDSFWVSDFNHISIMILLSLSERLSSCIRGLVLTLAAL